MDMVEFLEALISLMSKLISGPHSPLKLFVHNFACSVGDRYAVIAGGLDLNNVLSSVVDIFDGLTWTHPTHPLPVPRCQMATASDEIRAFFIGGITNLLSLDVSARVDIYNPVTDTWSLKLLTEARLNVACINVGLKVFVAGGGNYSTKCEVLNSETLKNKI